MFCRRGRFWGFMVIAFGLGLLIASLIPVFVFSLIIGLGLIALGCFLCK